MQDQNQDDVIFHEVKPTGRGILLWLVIGGIALVLAVRAARRRAT